MELSPELKAELGKRAIEIYSSVRLGALPSEAVIRDPEVFLQEEFAQALAEKRVDDLAREEINKGPSEKPVSKSKTKKKKKS